MIARLRCGEALARKSYYLKGEGESRTVYLRLDPPKFADSLECYPDRPLGRFLGKIRVVAETKAIFSAIRERIEPMETQAGTMLNYVIVTRKELPHSRVRLTCWVYDPSRKPAQPELERFKKD